MFRPGTRPPVQWLVAGQQWPGGSLEPTAPIEAIRAQQLVRALAGAMSTLGLSGRQVSATCGVDQRTVSRLLSGSSYPDIATLARIEAGLGMQLWIEAE